MKKVFVFAAAVILSCGLAITDAGALDLSSQSREIPENVAEFIAEYFIDDCRACEDSKWTRDTEITETVALYGLDGNVAA